MLFRSSDINLIKPGIGETTRVLLRRIPWKILVAEGERQAPSLAHIMRLAEEKNVPVEEHALIHYTGWPEPSRLRTDDATSTMAVIRKGRAL